MSIEDHQSDVATVDVRSGTRSRVPTEAAPSEAEPGLLVEVQELIRGILATPVRGTDPEIAVLLRGARKMHKNFQIALALRALRLEQGLRAAQQQIIRLQWELAQLRPRGASPFSSADENY